MRTTTRAGWQSTPWRRSDAHAAAAVFTLTTCVAGLYIASPDGIGKTARVLFTCLAAAVLAVGPVLRRSLPIRTWFIGIIGGSLFVSALMSPPSILVADALPLQDVLFFLGYFAFASWLVSLAWYVGRGTAARALLDTMAASVGALIALWTLCDTYRHGSVLGGIKWTIYPILDLILLVLSIHLGMLLRRLPPAWWWILASTIVQLVIDVFYAIHHMKTPGPTPPIISAGYLYTYGVIFLASIHPSVTELTHVEEVPAHHQNRQRPLNLIGVAVACAVASMGFPVHNVTDGVVRSMLVALLLLVLLARFRLTMRDLTAATAESSHRASHDGLTGLPNRATLFDHLTQRLQSNAVNGRRTAVLFLDCDDFKHVNDSWGHHAGDNLLRQIAEGLPRHLSPKELLARHGGDEFVIVGDVHDSAEAIELAERVRTFFVTPIAVLPERTHQLTFSIGIAVAEPGDGLEPVDLIRRADIALYEAKRCGRNRSIVFDDHLDERIRVRGRIAEALQVAIREDALSLDLQRIQGGPGYSKVVGWEALARWEHPELGIISPEEFVPVAEDLGLIYDLGETVLRRACRELAAFRAARPTEDCSISVNVSAPQLKHPGFAAVVIDAMREAGIDGKNLWLEITETLLVDKGDDVLDALADIRNTGVRLCIDDFGTGYASLATLMRLPIDCVKIDRSLVARLDAEPDAAEQLSRLLGLLESMRITDVIAEGVETPEQEARLLSMGCPMVQGWLYGQPQSAASIASARA